MKCSMTYNDTINKTILRVRKNSINGIIKARLKSNFYLCEVNQMNYVFSFDGSVAECDKKMKYVLEDEN